MKRAVTLVACAWLFAVAGVARGQPDDADARARANEQRGQARLAAHDYDGAIKEFETGYRNKPQPSFLYDIAGAAERGGQLQKAVDHYRLYLQMSPQAPDRDAVTQRIDELDKRLAAPPESIVAGPTAARPRKDHHKLIIGLSVGGAIVVLGAVAAGVAIAGQSQSEYHNWGTLAVTLH